MELAAQVVNADGGSESPILIGPGAANPAVLSHLKLFQDVGDTGSLELGTSFLYSRASGGRDDSYVLGADATYMWRDPQLPGFPQPATPGRVLLVEQRFRRRSEASSATTTGGSTRSASTSLPRTGTRASATTTPTSPTSRCDARQRLRLGISPYLTWYLYEALRLRLEYQHLERDQLGRDDTEDALLLG